MREPARPAGCGTKLAALLPLAAIIFAVVMFARGRAGPALPPDVITEKSQHKTCLGARCTACKKRCFLPEAATGFCRERINYGGAVRHVRAGKFNAPPVHSDPIE